jgi:hypothetical protein
MRKTLITAAAAALLLLAASGPATAQDQATIYTSPATTYTPSYYTPGVTLTPSYATVAPSISYPSPTISYTFRNYSNVPVNRPFNPPVVLTERPTISTNGLPFGYYIRSDSYPYYNPTLGTYYYQPDYNPGVTNGYFSYRYPTAYAPYRTYWLGTSYYRPPSSPIMR